MRKEKVDRSVLGSFADIFICYAGYRVTSSVLTGMRNDFVQLFLRQLFFAVGVFIMGEARDQRDMYVSDVRLFRKGWTSALPYLSLLFVLFLPVIPEMKSITASPFEIVLFILQMFLIGYCEETLFRGFLQNSFHRYFGEDSRIHVVMAVLCSGFSFGAFHLINGLSGAIGFGTAVKQAIGACGLGTLISAIYFRTGKCLWYVIFIHALNDGIGLAANGGLGGVSATEVVNLTSGMQSFGFIVIYSLILVFISLFLLRTKKIEPLLKQAAM